MTASQILNYRASRFFLVMRYALIGTLLTLGLRRLLGLAYDSADPTDLIRPLGAITSERFLAIWLSAPPSFSPLLGIVDVLAALLLFFSSTTALGGGLAVAVFFNASVLNGGFHTGELGRSLALLALASFVAWPDAWIFWQAFVLNRPIPCFAEPPQRTPGRRREVAVLRALLLLWLAVFGSTVFRLYRIKHDRSPVSGIYRVDRFVADDRLLSIETEPNQQWLGFAIDHAAGELVIRTTGGKLIEQNLQAVSAHHWGLQSRGDQGRARSGTLEYSSMSDGRISLKGTLHGTRLEVEAHRIDEQSFPFVNASLWAYPF